MIEALVLNMRWILMVHGLFNDPQHLLRFLQGRFISRFLPMTRWSWSGFWIVDSGAPKVWTIFLDHFPKIPRWWKNRNATLFERKGEWLNLKTFLFFEVSFVFFFKHVSLKWRMFFCCCNFQFGLEPDPWWHVGLSIGGFKPWSHSTWPGISEIEKNTGKDWWRNRIGIRKSICQFGSR